MKNSFNISARLVTKFLQICKKLNINNILKNISWNTELSAVLLSIGTNSPISNYEQVCSGGHRRGRHGGPAIAPPPQFRLCALLRLPI